MSRFTFLRTRWGARHDVVLNCLSASAMQKIFIARCLKFFSRTTSLNTASRSASSFATLNLFKNYLLRGTVVAKDPCQPSSTWWLYRRWRRVRFDASTKSTRYVWQWYYVVCISMAQFLTEFIYGDNREWIQAMSARSLTSSFTCLARRWFLSTFCSRQRCDEIQMFFFLRSCIFVLVAALARP